MDFALAAAVKKATFTEECSFFNDVLVADVLRPVALWCFLKVVARDSSVVWFATRGDFFAADRL